MKEYKFKINGNAYKVAVESVQDGIAAVSVNGTPYKVEIENDLGGPKPVKPVQVAPATYQATPQAAPVKIASAPPAGGSETQLRSPLPGTVLELRVKEGDTVKEGQTVMILEGMKMENNIDANKSGVVKSIVKRAGDSVMEGDVLITIG